MHKRLLAVVGAILVMAVAGYYVLNPGGEPPPPAGPVSVEPQVPAPAAPAPSHYPVEPSSMQLPALAASDAAFADALAKALGFDMLPAYFYPEQMIQRFVATIDNLPRARVSARLMPVQPVPGQFKVTGSGKGVAIDPANAARYQIYVSLMERADPATLVDVYLQWYPLFQQAYMELGYPRGYFNDRLMQAIDDMLDAPEAPGQVALVQPHVLYQFAEQDLERCSAGQKIMLRIGNENAARAKRVLRAIRERLLERTAGEVRG